MGPVVVVIPARYDSSRLPGKPLADIGGQPMIRRVYEKAAAAPGVDAVLVATDDERIRAAVVGFGGVAVMTSPSHPSGTDRIAEAVAAVDAEIVVNVQGDLPLLDPGSVAAAVAALRSDASLAMATLMTPIRDEAEYVNPNVVKVVTDAAGNALYFSRAPIPTWRDGAEPGAVIARRHIGLYAYRRDFLLQFARLAPTPLERAEKLEQLRALETGHRIRVVEVAAADIEVDTPADLDMVRASVRRSGGGRHE